MRGNVQWWFSNGVLDTIINMLEHQGENMYYLKIPHGLLLSNSNLLRNLSLCAIDFTTSFHFKMSLIIFQHKTFSLVAFFFLSHTCFHFYCQHRFWWYIHPQSIFPISFLKLGNFWRNLIFIYVIAFLRKSNSGCPKSCFFEVLSQHCKNERHLLQK